MPAGLLHQFPRCVQTCLKLAVGIFMLKLRRALHPLIPSKSTYLWKEVGLPRVPQESNFFSPPSASFIRLRALVSPPTLWKKVE